MTRIIQFTYLVSFCSFLGAITTSCRGREPEAEQSGSKDTPGSSADPAKPGASGSGNGSDQSAKKGDDKTPPATSSTPKSTGGNAGGSPAAQAVEESPVP